MGCRQKCCCEIGTDRFSLNDGSPHAGWTPDTTLVSGGSAPVNSGGVWHFTRKYAEIFNTPHPDGATGKFHVQVKMRFLSLNGTRSNRAGIIIGYLNPTTLLGAIVEPADADVPRDLLQLYYSDSTSGGFGIIPITTEGIFDFAAIPLKGFNLGDWLTLDVCLIPNTYGTGNASDTLRAKITMGNGSVYGVQAYVNGTDGNGFTGGSKVGLIVIDDNLAVDFDDFKFTYFKETPNHKVCPNCNGPCPIFSDDFQYDAVVDPPWHNEVGKYWEEITATVSVSGGTMSITNGGRAKCRFPHPTNKSSKIVTAGFVWESGIIAEVDLGSGYALFDADLRQIRLYDDTDVLLDTQTGLPAADNLTYTSEVCYEDGVFTASLTGTGITASASCIDAASTDTSDPFVYLGSAGGTVHFKSFDFKKHKDTSEPDDSKCDKCECVAGCGACQNNQRSSLLKAVFSGFGNTATCATCTGLNRTVVLSDRFGQIWDSQNPTCAFVYGDAVSLGVACPIENGTLDRVCEIIIWFMKPGDVQRSAYNGGLTSGGPAEPFTVGVAVTTYKVRIALVRDNENVIPPWLGVAWEKDYGSSAPDCINFQDESIPFLRFSTGAGTGECDSSIPDPVLLSAL